MSKPHDEGGQRFLDNLDPDRLVQSLFVTTDFESRSHPALERMIEAADPAQTERLGEKLTRAATTIDKIGQDIKQSRVAWEGDAADSFQAWSSRMSSATLRLGAMSKGAGEAMKNAAQTLREVKRDMPKHSSSAKATLSTYEMLNPGGLAKLDLSPPGKPAPDQAGPSREEALAAQHKLTEDHGEAVRQMRKLATSYTLTASAIHQPEKATFPPMPGELMPPKRENVRPGNTHSSPGSEEGSRTAAGAQETPPGAEGSVAAAPAPVSSAPDSTVTTALASSPAVLEAPTAPATIAAATPTGSGTTPPSGSMTPAAVAPEAFQRPDQRTAGPMPGIDGPGAPPANSMPGSVPPGLGRYGPLPAPLPGGPAGTKPGVRLPVDHGNGIYGGRPTPQAGQPPRGIPRGAVIGAEPGQAQQARPPMGYRPGGALGGMGPGAVGGVSQPGTAAGRPPMSSRPGGPVGSPQAPRPAPAGRPFTPGGTGLPTSTARPGNDAHSRTPFAGRGPVGGTGTPQRPPGGSRQGRPDYLVEDGGTWRNGNRRTVPPVVE